MNRFLQLALEIILGFTLGFLAGYFILGPIIHYFLTNG
jgi:hypothetical protein